MLSSVLFGLPPCPLTDYYIFRIGDPYKPSFATGILGGGTTQRIVFFSLWVTSINVQQRDEEEVFSGHHMLKVE